MRAADAVAAIEMPEVVEREGGGKHGRLLSARRLFGLDDPYPSE